VTFTHPETGELLDSREEFEQAIAEYDERLRPIYRARNEIRREWAERFENETPQPRPRYRTEKQEKVARCPRCGGRLESETAPEGTAS
jgi:hypothetical protein